MGVSLVELMITLTIFSIIISMIYSVYNTFLKTATAERKVAKTELDVINVSWPLIKEIESAGFGVPSFSCTPSVNQCACGISVSGDELIIHSTAAGNDEHAGKWAYVGASCSVTGLPTASGEKNVVVINNLDKSLLGYAYVEGTTATSLKDCGTNDCNSNYVNNLAYWVATISVPPTGTNLGCYETTYRLYAGTSPAMCAPDTQTLGRRVSKIAGSAGVNTQPMLDCVLALAYRFGCISSSGNLTWQSGTNCGTSKLRLMKVGVIVQSSPRRDSQVPNTITLFEDLGAALDEPVDLDSINTELRFYKWRKVEQTISLRNLE